jgi:hypothetical protein
LASQSGKRKKTFADRRRLLRQTKTLFASAASSRRARAGLAERFHCDAEDPQLLAEAEKAKIEIAAVDGPGTKLNLFGWWADLQMIRRKQAATVVGRSDIGWLRLLPKWRQSVNDKFSNDKKRPQNDSHGGLFMRFRTLLTSNGFLQAIVGLFFFASTLAVRVDAAPIILQQTNQFCDARSVNDVNFGVGRFLTLTADLTPDGDLDGDGFADSDGISPPSTVVASQDGVNVTLNYFPLVNSPNHFARSVRFDCNSPTVPDLRDAWTFSITNGADNCVAGECTLTNGTAIANPTTPIVHGFSHLPFVTSFTFQTTGDPTTPTFNWTAPLGSAHDRVTIWIQDLQDFIGRGGVGGGGAARVIFSQRLADDATSFAMPAGVLNPDHLYSVSIQLDQLRSVQPVPLGRLANRSRVFFSFQTVTLPTGGAPVYLPSVNPAGVAAGHPVYQFHVDNVQANQITFIDPPLAIGYDYQTGVGNPNFTSVLLPPVGDNLFDVHLWNGSDFAFYATVRAGEEYPFPVGGVDRFRVLGVDPGLDPNNPTAFVTGLKFSSAGQFTGTMTPIIIPDATTVDLKPGDGPSCINPKSKGEVPFAILGGDVDASLVNRASLEIDDDTNTATAGVKPARSSIKDVNGDGINDLVMHFRTQDLNTAKLLTDGRTVYITGQLSDGTLLVGYDVIYLADGPTCK